MSAILDFLWQALVRHLGLDFDIADLLPSPAFLNAMRLGAAAA